MSQPHPCSKARASEGPPGKEGKLGTAWEESRSSTVGGLWYRHSGFYFNPEFIQRSEGRGQSEVTSEKWV